MKTIKISLILLLVVAGFWAADSAHASDVDEKAVGNALAKFYSSLNAMFTGDADMAKEVWSQADDVTYMGADGGYEVGWDKVYADWEAQAALKLGGKVEASDIVITVGQDLAVAHNYVKGVNISIVGKRREDSLRATSVFRKEDGQWKMIGHHVDIIPSLEKELRGQ